VTTIPLTATSNWSAEFKERDINYNTIFFIETVSSAVDPYKVNKGQNDSNPPWWSKTLAKFITTSTTNGKLLKPPQT